jgi:hypothetical protein
VKAIGSIASAIVAFGGPMLAALGAVVLLSSCASCQSTVRQASLPALTGASIDGTAFDSRSRTLYLADTANHGVAVVDMSGATPQFVHTIDVTRTPHALAYAADQERLYVALSGGTVAVIDTKSTSANFLQVITRITVAGATPSALSYDARSKQLIVATGSYGQVVSVNTLNDGIHGVYPLGAPVGDAAYNSADGMVYATVPSADAVYRIRPSDGTVVRKFGIKGCRPSAMAINGTGNVALVGCRGSIGVVGLKSGDNSVTRSVAGANAITYDAATDRFAVASPHGANDSALGVFAGDGTLIGSVAATPNSSSAVFDDSRGGLVYAPTAAGLLSVNPGACLPPPDWLKFTGNVAIFAVPLGLAALFLVLYARGMDRRPAKRRPAPTYSDLQKEDLAMERERMRAFEDSMFGPQISPEP